MSCYKCKYHNWEEPQEVVWSDLTGQEYCVFHAPTYHKGVSEADFVALVTKHLEMSINQNYPVCNLAGTIFCGHIDFPDQKLPKLDLRDTSFEGRVVFKGCCFGSDVSFDGASFLNGVSFLSTKFMGNVYFNETKFLNGVWFAEVDFFGTAVFVDTEFSYGRFLRIVATAPVFIRYSRFSPNNYIDFVEVDLFWFDFLSTNLENIRFTGCCWPIDNERYCVQHEIASVQLFEVLEFYRSMKRKYKIDHNEYEASKWHIAEKEVQAKLLAHDKESGFIRLMLWLYKISSYFGERPLRAFCWVCFFVFSPLVVISLYEISKTFSWTIDWQKVDCVIKTWLMFLPLTGAKDSLNGSGGTRLFMFFWQLLTSIQSALFAFALRNRFRR